MAVNSQTITLQEYRAISELPENADKLLELIHGEIVEKVPSFTPSMIASRISAYLNMYLLKNNIGYVTGEAGGYIMDAENVLIPDVGYISKERLPETPEREAPVPPDLAVEVKSPTDRIRNMRNKAEAYLTFGTRMVWLVFPEDQTIEVYLPDEDVKTLTVEDTLEGGEVLPGFTLPIHDIFAV